MDSDSLWEAIDHTTDMVVQRQKAYDRLEEFLVPAVAHLRTHRTRHTAEHITIRDGSIYFFEDEREIPLHRLVDYKDEILDGLQHPNIFLAILEDYGHLFETDDITYATIPAQTDPDTRLIPFERPILTNMAWMDEYGTIDAPYHSYDDRWTRDMVYTLDVSHTSELDSLPHDHDQRRHLFKGIRWCHAYHHKRKRQYEAALENIIEDEPRMKKYAMIEGI